MAIARAALREPDLPLAHLDEVARALRLLVDHREDLVAERTRHINRLRWHLHEIDPAWDPKAQSLITCKHLALCATRLAGESGVIAQVALDLVVRVRELTRDIRRLEPSAPGFLTIAVDEGPGAGYPPPGGKRDQWWEP